MEFENSYSVVLSADRRVPTIIAYTDNGGFTEHEFLNPDAESDDLGEYLAAMIINYIYNSVNENPTGKYGTSSQNPPDGDDYLTDPVIVEQIKPLVRTKWNQFSPFNKYVTSVRGTTTIAGCIPLASVQIFAYHKRPSSYYGKTWDWTGIRKVYSYDPNYSTGTTAAQNALSEFLYHYGTSLNVRWGATDTSGDTALVPGVMRQMGYNNCLYKAYNQNEVFAMIRKKLPVQVAGGTPDGYGHSWVVSGFKHTKADLMVWNNGSGWTKRDEIHRYYTHASYGWPGGRYDGYFSNSIFTTFPEGFEPDLNEYRWVDEPRRRFTSYLDYVSYSL